MAFPILAAIALVQAIGGGAKALKGSADRSAAEQDAKDLLAKRTPYKVPKELEEVLNATQYNAQSGFDAETLQYLTNQTDQAFSGSLDIAKQLGADPNALSAIFGQKVDAISGIAAQDHAMRMQNFNAYVNAQTNIAGAKDAVWQSKENLIKDQQQAAQARRMAASEEIAGGTNMILSAASNYATSRLYNTGNTNGSGAVGGSGNGDLAVASGSYSDLNKKLGFDSALLSGKHSDSFLSEMTGGKINNQNQLKEYQDLVLSQNQWFKFN